MVRKEAFFTFYFVALLNLPSPPNMIRVKRKTTKKQGKKKQKRKERARGFCFKRGNFLQCILAKEIKI